MLLPIEVLKFGKGIVKNDPTRFAINRVLIESKGEKTRAVATNGKILGILSWNPDDLENVRDFPVIDGIDNESRLSTQVKVEQADLDAILKTVPKRSPRPMLSDYVILSVVKDVAAKFGIADFRKSQVINIQDYGIEDRFPEVDEVVPKDKSGNKVTLGIGELMALLGSMKATGCTAIELTVKDDPTKEVLVSGEFINEDNPRKLDYKGLILPIVRR